MSEQVREPSSASSSRIDGYQDIKPRQVSPTEYRVLSLRNGENTAHRVDLEELSCSCEDMQYNRDDPSICAHLAVTLDQAPRKLDAGEYAVADLVKLVDRVQALSKEIRDIRDMEAAVRDANAQAAAESPDEPESTDTVDDPVGTFKGILGDAGLDAGDFKVYLHDEFGSLQVEQDGYLGDGEFETWVDLKDDLGMNYDPDSDTNYISEEEYKEVFG